MITWKGSKVLVTGGAGLIGSHIVDRLLEAGAVVTILDNLEPQTHPSGKPDWIPAAAQFVQGDVRAPEDLRRVVAGVQVVFHQAAFGGHALGNLKFQEVNVVGTGRLYEAIAAERTCKKIVVASSQAVYGEGLYSCTAHGLAHPAEGRALGELKARSFDCRCRVCGETFESVPTPEHVEPGGLTPYASSKLEGERLALSLGAKHGIPTAALRYALTYGPRQSVFNPYTGVVSIFSTRLLNGKPPVVYEDGRQTRDFIYVNDVAEANLLVARKPESAGQVYNVGTGKAVSVLELVDILNELYGTAISPEIRSFRPGDVRHLRLDGSKLASLGFSPRVSLREGLAKYAAWIRGIGNLGEYFTEAEQLLRDSKRVLDA